MYALREAIKSITRMPVMAVVSILTITVTLTVLSVLVLATVFGHDALQKVRTSEEINVYLLDSMKDEDMLALDAVIASMTEVAQTTILSKDDARKEFARIFGDDLVAALDRNPLPRTIVVHMTPEHTTYDDLERVVRRISTAEGVESVEYGREWMSKLDVVFAIIVFGESVFGILALAACLLLISNTISLTVIARRETIEIMQLVGATNSFIRRPFYVEGMLQGFVSGAITFGLIYGVWRWIEKLVPDIETYRYMLAIPGHHTLSGGLALSLIIPVGATLGLIGSFIAVRRVF